MKDEKNTKTYGNDGKGGLDEEITDEKVGVKEQEQELEKTDDSTSNSVQDVNSTVSQEQIDMRRTRNQAYRDALEKQGALRFGFININGDEIEELVFYTYDSEIEDRGPDRMYTLDDGEACGAGKGILENMEYCLETKHFISTHYYEDGSYEFRIYEYQGPYYGDELIYSGTSSDYQFAFHVDSNGQYSFGTIDSLSYEQKLTVEQVLYVEHKIVEYLPTRTKVIAPYAVTKENLDKYLPVDDAGIIAQLTE